MAWRSIVSLKVSLVKGRPRSQMFALGRRSPRYSRRPNDLSRVAAASRWNEGLGDLRDQPLRVAAQDLLAISRRNVGDLDRGDHSGGIEIGRIAAIEHPVGAALGDEELGRLRIVL